MSTDEEALRWEEISTPRSPCSALPEGLVVCSSILCVTMSTRNPSEPSDLQENKEKQKNVPEDEFFSEDFSSVSPVKDDQALCETEDSGLVSGQTLHQSGILGHLQPLKSVREVVEAEETCEPRAPGDGEVLIEEPTGNQEIFPTAAIRYTSLTMEGLGDALERVLLGPVVESTTKSDFADLESPMTEACSSVHEVPVGLWLQEDSLKVSVSDCQQVERGSSAMCGDQKEMSRHQLAEANSGVLEGQLDSRPCVAPLRDLLNPTEEHASHQNGKLGLDDRPNAAEFQGHEKEESVANLTLTEVLTSCKAKVEQNEQLKPSSFDLPAQLHAAQSLAARLHHRVLCLEREHHLKEKELQELTANLEKTSEALEVRNSEMAAITKELQQLHSELEAKKTPPGPARTLTANGQTPPHPAQNGRGSKVCTLL